MGESTTSAERMHTVSQVTVVGAIVNLLLAVTKVSGGIVSNSQALVADGLHSFSDLASDALVYWAVRQGSQEPDEEHPYGHARIETAATVVLGLLLIMVGAGIVWDAGIRLLTPEAQVVPRSLALWFAAFSILANEALYWYTLNAAKRVGSALLRANAWHHRTDAASSVIVLLAVGGALAGLPWLDAVGAAGVALMIAWIGTSLVRSSVRELVDTGLDPEQVEAIRSKILAVDGVRDMHLLRTRSMGGKALVDVHILLLDPRVSVSEGHQISETVRAELIQAFDEIDDVTVHIDPEDDEHAPPSQHLPLRGEVLRRLDQAWSTIEARQSIRHVTIHYLDGKLHADLELPLSVLPDPKAGPALAAAFAEAAQGDPDVAEVRVFFY